MSESPFDAQSDPPKVEQVDYICRWCGGVYRTTEELATAHAYCLSALAVSNPDPGDTPEALLEAAAEYEPHRPAKTTTRRRASRAWAAWRTGVWARTGLT
jgi:hypothetical protein